MTVPRITPSCCAPTSVRRRKIENGINTSDVRASQAMNAVSKMADAVNRPACQSRARSRWPV